MLALFLIAIESSVSVGERNSLSARSGEAARSAVWRAIQAVGGIASPAGSCLWHVLGWERSLKEWAQEQGWAGRRVSQEAASGILVAALGALAEAGGSFATLTSTR